MKFTIIRSKFLEGLKSVQNIVGGKGSAQIMQNALLEAKEKELWLTTTDTDITVRSKVECDVQEPGSTTLPVKILFGTISRVAEGPVYVELDEQEHATVSAGSATFKIAGLPAQQFPLAKIEEGRVSYTLPQATFRDMLRKTAYAITTDETRKTLRGLLMSFKGGKLTMVATDGRRLALVEQEVEFPADAEQDVVLPAKTVAELPRSLGNEGDVKIIVDKTQITFDLGKTKVSSKLLDQVYPNYRQVIPADMPNTISIDRQLLLDALDRTSIMANEQTNAIKLTFDNNQLTVAATSTDVGEARDIVPIKYVGERIEIMFNPAYVMEPLKAIDEDEVRIEVNNGHSPAILKCSIPFLYVLMPLRLTA